MFSYLFKAMDDMLNSPLLGMSPSILRERIYSESKWTVNSDNNETVISYVLPGVEKSQLRVKVEEEDGEKILVVEVSERDGGVKNGGGLGSDAKTTKFHFFPGEVAEKTSSELKNGVLTIRIPKEVVEKPVKTMLEIPVA